MAINPRIRRQRFAAPRSRSGIRPAAPPDLSHRSTGRRPADPKPARRGRDARPDAAGGEPPSATLDEALASFTASWDRGEPTRAEDYVGGFGPAEVAELIYHEYCLAEAAGLGPDPAAFLRRFPDHAETLGRLFSLHGALSVTSLQSLVAPGGLPDVGDEIGPYLLLRELGRGAFARVFLAEQADLGDRLVVVKVSARPSAEPTLLARARHANIVEVLRSTEANDGELHLICLPFLGGATLGAVLGVRRGPRRGGPGIPRSGQALLAALDHASAPEYPSTDLPRPAREIIARATYPQALAWMMARLAGALDHAQLRGVTHGDIKPSNILITADGTPMLFDFNLAVDRLDATDLAKQPDPGGTLAYMAPERLQALADPDRSDPGAPAARRPPNLHRADLYALGLVLLEALTGRAPALPDRRSDDARSYASSLAELRGAGPRSHPALRSRAIPAGLRAVLERCLAPDPSDRYARGIELAVDLDRWRTDRPLMHAAEPARAAWARQARSLRFPILALGLTAVVALIVALVAARVMAGTRRDQALAKWSHILDHTEGVFQATKFGRWRSDTTEDPAALATRHLAHYDVLKDPRWRDRPDVRDLPDRERGELEAWLLEQILRRAVAYGDRPDSPEDWRRGLVLLDRELARTSYSAFLRQKAILIGHLGDDAARPDAPGRGGSAPGKPQPWLEAYLAGVLAEPLHARQALGHYLDALATRPNMFWAHYRLAGVACRIDEYPLAIESLRECVARRPENATLRNLLAGTMFTLGRFTVPGSAPVSLADAQAECDRALAINPDYASANRTRTMIDQYLGQSEGARADIERFSLLARMRRSNEATLHRISSRFISGEMTPYTSAEEASLRRAIEEEAKNEDQKYLLANGLIAANRTSEAVELYEQVIASNPSHLNARFQHAIELFHRKDPRAIAEFRELIEHPRFEELYRDRSDAFRAYHYIAHDLLKSGLHAEAEVMIDRCLDAVNRNSALRPEAVKGRNLGKPEVNPRAETNYYYARVNIVAARTDPTRLARSIGYLKVAFAESQVLRRDWFPKDPLFDHDRSIILDRVASED